MSNITEAIVLGDGRFFWDLRPLRHYSERVCFVTSLISNTVLMFLISKEKNPHMVPYSRVLLLNLVYDYFYSVCSMALQVEIEMNSGAYIFVVNGFPKHLPSAEWQKTLVGVWLTALAATCNVSVVEFVFRYLRVCKNYTMSYMWLTISGLAVLLISTWHGTFWYLAMDSVEDPKATFGHLMSDPIWREDGIVYYGADVNNIFFQTFRLSVAINDSMVLAVLAFSTVATLRKLAADQEHMSAKVASLMSVFVVPLLTAMIFLMLRVQWVGFGVLLSILLQWVPAVNPVTTIFLVGPYRKRLFGTRKKLDASSNPPSAAMASATTTLPTSAAKC